MKPDKNDPAEQKLQAIETEMSMTESNKPQDEEIMPGIRPMSYGELAKLDIPPPAWIVDKLIPGESITIISSVPGQFKTWLAFDIAIRVAQGEALFGQFDTKQTKVLIVDEESRAARLRKRLQMLGATDDMQIFVTSDAGYKLSENTAKSLSKYCNAQGIGLVVFDSLTRLHSADENNAQAMAAVMADFKRLTQAGLAVLLIHHNRKPAFGKPGGANEMRGSIDILASCDAQISMKRDGNSRLVKVTQNKNRDAEEVPTFSLELVGDDDRCRFEYRGHEPKQVNKSERTDNAILELLAKEGQQFQQQIIEALKEAEGVGSERMISDRLKILHETAELTRESGASGRHIYALRQRQPDE